jgi:hypothetical protein
LAYSVYTVYIPPPLLHPLSAIASLAPCSPTPYFALLSLRGPMYIHSVPH